MKTTVIGTAVLAVAALLPVAAEARSATHGETARMTSALRHEIRAARAPNCRLGNFRVGDQDELYGAATVYCHKGRQRWHSEFLMERNPWHIVESCVRQNIADAVADLHLRELDVCEENTQAQEEASQEATEQERATRLCQATHEEYVYVGSAEFKCP